MSDKPKRSVRFLKGNTLDDLEDKINEAEAEGYGVYPDSFTIDRYAEDHHVRTDFIVMVALFPEPTPPEPEKKAPKKRTTKKPATKKDEPPAGENEPAES